MIRPLNGSDTLAPGSVESLALLPLSVVIVTAGVAGRRSCATATATYASIDPPMVVVPLRPTSTTYRLAVEHRSFSLAVVASDEVELASKAARGWPGDDKPAAAGLPLLEDAAVAAVATGGGALWCEVSSLVPTGDHVLVVGRVTRSGGADRSPEPLLRHEHRYRLAGAALTEPGPSEHPL